MTISSRRTFLVTGATKGIGRALSHRLAEDGHRVVGVARRPDATFPGELASIDLADVRATGEALAELVARHDFDGVVNNAGMVRMHRVGEIPMDDVDAILHANLHPAIQTTQALLPGLRAKGFGRIVNLASLTVLGVERRAVYAASKAALVTFTRTTALEQAGTGITANVVAPGPVATELFRENTPAGSAAEAKFLELIPMRRLGEPREIAAAIAFLLSDDAGFVTGQTLFVDGGGSVGRAAA